MFQFYVDFLNVNDRKLFQGEKCFFFGSVFFFLNHRKRNPGFSSSNTINHWLQIRDRETTAKQLKGPREGKTV